MSIPKRSFKKGERLYYEESHFIAEVEVVRNLTSKYYWKYRLRVVRVMQAVNFRMEVGEEWQCAHNKLFPNFPFIWDLRETEMEVKNDCTSVPDERDKKVG